MVIRNDENEFFVTEEIIQDRYKKTRHVNHTSPGTVEQTYLRGLKVFENGSFIAMYTGKILKMDI